ncbi:glycogen/starch/alpha-glucan phosphorylase [Azospirillum sp. RWY-5-1]|uniref:Alpha-1,4 glucan phosphorylase n=1 Tax=Azospirillum oleiclasticum TaxID=2735135 RepID=A0ABX2T4P1_9PROT|nr:glycogen/starch/alpha-glucan phosphorylase [Azospirillum oleiclasticum]NYZ12019.1 glycogen/starch/alpha-glucan phosphorylase [Azospirillum oleiclasticum]NYZ19179.1 glycogen/starch/alpha-glucan phosphorylase [Azospirillum oleiclasticum]
MDARYRTRDIERRSLDVDALKRSFLEWLVYSVGKDARAATRRDWFHTVALAVRDRVVDRWMDTTRTYYTHDVKRVYYLSLEFLIGRLLTNSLANLGIIDECRQALDRIGLSLDEVVDAEPDAALGNGGLGRLAACFLDSMASRNLPGYGYGIRYEFGLFEQRFEHGWQVEYPEQWLQFGNPWEFARPEVLYPVQFYGRVEEFRDSVGERAYRWVDSERVLAMAYDTPVVGFGGKTINTLRLWAARATRDFNFGHFNEGAYMKAVEQKILSENLSRVLYPNDATETGKELRFKQEYFFTSASLQDILRRYLQHHSDFDQLPNKAAIQLNDTHPAIGIAEMMRLLVDQHAVKWDKAWEITQGCFSYTNHTLLPEALEAWPVRLLERVLPRHMQIIYEINAKFLNRSSARAAHDNARLSHLSLIDERGDRRVRMGNLAFIGSHKVNGVSALHTELMKQTVFADFHAEFPDRIVNKTNGITPRRWLHQANRPLSDLITSRIGEGWIHDLSALDALKPKADDVVFREEFRRAKRKNKKRLAAYLARQTGVEINVDSLFDVQVKRIHEYKRQLMNILQTIALYNDMRDSPTVTWTPVTKIFAGKAAPAYHMAKLIIKLINDVGKVVNHDPSVHDNLKVVFLPNYNVTAAEIIMPAADLSEQISTAGMEASGTGNMKLALNGALTIGTLDGANVEIKDAVGDDNIFIFGLTAEEANSLRQGGAYNPRDVIGANPALKRALDMISTGVFSPDDPSRYHPILQSLIDGGDHFLVTADFEDYCTAHDDAVALYRDTEEWTRKAILNTTSMGWFSSDRTVGEYADEIWGVKPIIPDEGDHR